MASEATVVEQAGPVATVSLTTAADAMHDEEVERTRLFIRFGWLLSVFTIGSVLALHAQRAISIVFVVGLVAGMVISYACYRRFADPRNYTDRAIAVLAETCVINGHIAVLFYGAYSGAPLIVVVGIHFIARTEHARVARWIFASTLVQYAAIAVAITSGLIADPGVFASDHAVDRATLVAGSVFVLGAYALAYYTARVFRAASLTSIEDLQRATRLASQREALMDELRADLERALQVGGPGRYTDHVVGKFRLGVVLGRGAMGEVYDAAHVETGAPAAVKLLRRELLADATQVARFLREVRACAALASPHVVRVLDASDAGVPFLAMERLHGATLAEFLRARPQLAPAATLELCRHAALGIDTAAAAGIVHRDLKPQNLMLADGTWKILDFGVASLSADTGTLTHGDVVGTPHYMAPEQAQGHRVDGRADVYALGAIVYRCMTGSYPFNAADTPALLYAVVHRMPARPGSLAELPADVDRWCAIALAKSPDDRFASGAALADALADALAGTLDPKPRRRADPQAPVGCRVTTRTTLTSPVEALRAEEVRRTRAFLRVGWLVAAGAAVAVVIAPGDPRIARVLLATLAVGVAVSVWTYDQLRDPERYAASRMTALAVACVACGQLGILYVGAFSAAPLMVGLGLYFFCRTESRASAIAIYTLAAGAHAVLAVLVMSGAVDDPGFYPVGRQVSIPVQLAGQTTLQLVYAACYWLARATRESSLKSIEQLQQATRLAAQRDIQLAELRRDLDRALEIGGPGRFTGVAVGSWQLGNVLGRGAMGEVYEATHTTTGAPGAVKLLRRELLADAQHVERFLREVRVASAIDSPHVVRVLEASGPVDAVPFLAMERLSGQTLASLLRKGRTLNLPAVVKLATQVGGALERARVAGVVHRDIKPQNLMLTYDDTWKVLDFGVALLGDSSGTLTRGAAVGTPAYMAPEQARGDSVDHRADVYALGAVIYRCVTGRAPYAGRDTPSLLYAVVHQAPPRPSTIARVSPELEAVLALALAKSPDARFATAGELVAAITGGLSEDQQRRVRGLASWR